MTVKDKKTNDFIIDTNITTLSFQFHNEKFMLMIMNRESIMAIYLSEKGKVEIFEDYNIYAVLDWITSKREVDTKMFVKIDMALNILAKKFDQYYISDLKSEIIKKQIIEYLGNLVINDKFLEVNRYINTYICQGDKIC